MTERKSEALVSQHIQDCIIHLLINDAKFLRLAQNIVSYDLFTSPICGEICAFCIRHFERYQDAPKQHFEDSFREELRASGRTLEAYHEAYLDKLRALEQPSKVYVTKQLSAFVRARKLEDTTEVFTDLVARGEFDEAERLMLDALKSGIPEHVVGIDYFNDLSRLSRREDDPEYLMQTGIKALDDIIGGYKRSQFILFLGGYKGGKTWSLTHLARAALVRGLKVLHVSHEVGLDEMEDRYDMCFGGLVSDPDPQEIEYCSYDEDTQQLTWIKKEFGTIRDAKKVRAVRQRVQRYGGQLRIVKYPAQTCSMIDINTLLRNLEMTHNWIPDVLINDYPDIMRPLDDKKSTRDQLNDSFLWHKRLADEHDCLVATVSQVNRNAAQSPLIRQKDVAEDIRKIANIDLGIAICQSPQNAAMGIARLFVAANRSGPQDQSCFIGRCFAIGQFCTWSARRVEFPEDKEEE